MKSILLAGAFALVSLSAVAADAPAAAPAVAPAAAPAAAAPAGKKPLGAQQQKMKDCNASATGKKGAERKAYMKSCLSGGSADAAAPAAAAPAAALSPKAAQQEKMKTCNADAKSKGLKGADRKTFMSTCLKG